MAVCRRLVAGEMVAALLRVAAIYRGRNHSRTFARVGQSDLSFTARYDIRTHLQDEQRKQQSSDQMTHSGPMHR
eukprot:11190908-Lingulodinium_polyedra.AAC.1